MRLAPVFALIAAASLAACASTPAPQAAKPAATKPARTAAQIPMEELMDKPEANAVFKKHAPDLAANPQLSMARGMTLAEVAGYDQAGLSPEMVRAIVDDVNKL
jgi:type IV pilus biogenesis protein CpaD/CtpE